MAYSSFIISAVERYNVAMAKTTRRRGSAGSRQTRMTIPLWWELPEGNYHIVHLVGHSGAIFEDSSNAAFQVNSRLSLK